MAKQPPGLEGRVKEEGKDRKCRNLGATKSQIMKPFLVLAIIFFLAIALSTAYLHLDKKLLGPISFDSADDHPVTVMKSPSDSRNYRYFVLENGLKALAVSDPSTDRSSAAMDVSVGSFSDPDDIPGLAHFLEHMLFMGSEIYPDENEYSSYLSQHGGGSNAYTASESTNYHFDLPSEHFPGALDRFAQFFISPLFRAESTEREVLAVENEHVKNLQSDGWRGMQLFKSLVNPEHPLHKFGTGNLHTLCNTTATGTLATRCEGTRKAMMQLYREHYTAHRMRLVVLHTMGLDELEVLIRSTFAGIPPATSRAKREPPQWSAPVRPPSLGARWVSYVPITEQRRLGLSWQLPPMHSFFRHKAGAYLSHLLGHEGQGSVAAVLKRRGLIESLNAGASTDQRYGAEVELSVSLTPLGLAKVDDVVSTIFDYVRLLRQTGPLEWVWRESSDLAAIRFRFQEKREPLDLAVAVAANLQLYPPEYALSAGYAFESFDLDMINWVLERLDPGQVDITLCSQSVANQTTQVEAIYGTPYTFREVTKGMLSRWKGRGDIDKELHIVQRNRFIPSNLTLLPTPEGPPVPPLAPKKLMERNGARLWYKQDFDFPGKNWAAKPKVVMLFQIVSPGASATPRAVVLTSLFTALYADSLTLLTYDAQVAGLSWSLSGDMDGLSLTISGLSRYNDKANLLLTQVTDPLVACLRTGTPCDWAVTNRFETMKDELRRGLENRKKAAPYSRAMESMGQLLLKRGWSVDRLIAALSRPAVDMEGLAAHVLSLFEKAHVEAFIHGNVDQTFARRSLETVLSAIGSLPLEDNSREIQQVVRLSTGNIFAELHTNPDDLNHAIELYYQADGQGVSSDVTSTLIGEMASEPCFNQLRTIEQLGYIVSCRSRPMLGTYPPAINGFGVIIQSSLKEPKDLDQSARSFVEGFAQNMSQMSETVFQAHKEALLARIREKDMTMSDETGRIWGEIVKRRFAWDRQKQMEDALAPLTIQKVSASAKKMLDLNAHSLAVWVYGKQMLPPSDDELLKAGEARVHVHSIAKFKQSPPAYFPSMPPTKTLKVVH